MNCFITLFNLPTFRSVLLLGLIALSANSCTITKRRYTAGWHVEWKEHQRISDPEKEANDPRQELMIQETTPQEKTENRTSTVEEPAVRVSIHRVTIQQHEEADLIIVEPAENAVQTPNDRKTDLDNIREENDQVRDEYKSIKPPYKPRISFKWMKSPWFWIPLASLIVLGLILWALLTVPLELLAAITAVVLLGLCIIGLFVLFAYLVGSAVSGMTGAGRHS